jgi:hypothetical protein
MIKPCGLVCCVAYPSHPSLSSSLSAPCLVSLPASAAIAGTLTARGTNEDLKDLDTCTDVRGITSPKEEGSL